GAADTIIDVEQRGRVMLVGVDGVAELRGLTIAHGLGDRSFGVNPDGGGINNHGTLTLTDVVVRDNSLDPGATGAQGAALYNTRGASLTLVRSTVTRNIAPLHGGGGGIHTAEGATLTIRDSLITDNVIKGTGGGIVNIGSTVTITGSTISGNTTISGPGGGIANFGASIQDFNYSALFIGDLTMVNSTISGNTSGSSGGGIYDHFFTTIHLNNVTIAGNTGAVAAGTGGGIATFATDRGIFLRNTIIARNVDARGTSAGCDARNVPTSVALTSLGHNLIGDTTNCVLLGDST